MLVTEDQGKLSLMGFHKSSYVAAKHRNKLPASFQPQMTANLWFNSWVSSVCLPLTLCQRQSSAKAACEGVWGKTLPGLCQVIQKSPSICFETGLQMVLNWRRKKQHVLLQQWSWGMATCSSWAQAVRRARSRWRRTILDGEMKLHTACLERVGKSLAVLASLGFFSLHRS